MIFYNKIPLGVYADDTSIKNNFLFNNDNEYHCFGDNNYSAFDISKTLRNFNKSVIYHTSTLTLNIVDEANKNKIIISYDINNEIPISDFILLPKINYLILNIENITKTISDDICNIVKYYFSYHRYYCKLTFNVINNNEVEYLKRLPLKLLQYNILEKNNFIKKYTYIIPYKNIYYSIKENYIFFNNKAYNIPSDYKHFYKTIYTPQSECYSCELHPLCEKYNIQNCTDKENLISQLKNIIEV